MLQIWILFLDRRASMVSSINRVLHQQLPPEWRNIRLHPLRRHKCILNGRQD